ncbi:hypothetical protein [Sphingomonas sp.]|uniref:hypothetical protein n=1 Tax=Sphingomonas sp. TaxID=28214 RepID=UPI001EB8DCEC|nr:hypothetical protein [Sphingomonas sp.]MBX3593582.1 hypothetical protein [Sphingomonas sp.]
MIGDIILIVAAIGIALVTLNPRLLRSAMWRATVTPLASIIGSGFLVAGPILGHAAGHWAFLGMAGLCAVSWVFGLAIRENIRRAEPMLADNESNIVDWMDWAASLALAFAYFVSVAYYLDLLSAFALKGLGIVDADIGRILTTAIIATLGVLGLFGGLRWLEHVELGSVGVKLALIGGIIAALLWTDASHLAAGTLDLTKTANVDGFESVRILLGLVILVQGFETSRYLGDSYDRETRVRTMRNAQLIAFGIYIAFIGLLTPWLDGRLPPQGGETHIIELLRPVGAFIPAFVIGAALMSQLSAAVADMNGGSGLLHGAAPKRVPVGIAYVVCAVASIAIVWSTDIFGVIVWASKAFVLYYGIQAVTAITVEIVARDTTRWGRVALFTAAALLAVAVLILGKSAEG